MGARAWRGGPAMGLPLILILSFLLAACGSTSAPELSAHRAGYRPGHPMYKVGPSYQINGVWYYPKVDYDYDQNGTASWYGPGFDKQVTANGEIYDMNGLTAAHKTLPLPSIVQVTNLQNGRALQLRVNDRGPYVGDRVIDLSRRAAQLLGFEGAGTAPVNVKILKEPSIRVAEAAMRGEFGDVRVADAARTNRPEPAPRPQPIARAHLVAQPQAPPAARTEIVAANWPNEPPPLRPAEVVAAPLPPEPPPRPTQFAATPPPESGPPSRRYFPSFIGTAHAEVYRAPMAAAASGRGSGRIYVQAGAFSVPENARRVRSRIASLGSVEIVPPQANGSALYRVRVGPVASEAEADRLRSKVVESGFPDARIVGE
ncbi:MAG TPA: septal ring lytic transglycosylase RlpA family protein [Stellaceae bacterium]